MHGSRKSSCRDRERKTDLFTMPRHWNRLVVTIWKPTMGKTMFMMRSPCAAFWMSTGSEVKMRAMGRARKTEKIKPMTITSVAQPAVLRYTSRRRLYCRAP